LAGVVGPRQGKNSGGLPRELRGPVGISSLFVAVSFRAPVACLMRAEGASTKKSGRSGKSRGLGRCERDRKLRRKENEVKRRSSFLITGEAGTGWQTRSLVKALHQLCRTLFRRRRGCLPTQGGRRRDGRVQYGMQITRGPLRPDPLTQLPSDSGRAASAKDSNWEEEGGWGGETLGRRGLSSTRVTLCVLLVLVVLTRLA